MTVAPTKVVHISDTHLGALLTGSDGPIGDFAWSLERAVLLAVERGADAVVHTGDLFDDPVPALPTVTRCVDLLAHLDHHDIPFYGIVGTHDRREDEQWLDLFARTNAATRLTRDPTVVGSTALYGIDAVAPGDWGRTDFALATPPAGVDSTILCMHELLEPPADVATAEHPVADVLDGVGIELDGLALGGSHRPRSARVDGTDVWYAGATGRFLEGDPEPGVVQVLSIDDGHVERREVALVDDDLPVDRADAGRPDGTFPTARNALETAALQAFRRRSGRSRPTDDATAPQEATGSDRTTADDGSRTPGEHPGDDSPRDDHPGDDYPGDENPDDHYPDDRHPDDDHLGDDSSDTHTLDDDVEHPPHDDDHTADMTDERDELIDVRERIDADLADREAAIEDLQARIDEREADLATAVGDRDSSTDAFLPDDRVPESVTTDTRDAVASFLDELAERRDVRSEGVSRKQEALAVERMAAANARDDVEEIAAAIERIRERTAESESTVEAAREELESARSRFETDLETLAEELAAYDVELTADTLEAVIEERIPERRAELQAEIIDASDRVAELSTRKSALQEEREHLRSIEGGGTCPTCSQQVGPDRNESELQALEEELATVEDELATVTDHRAAVIDRSEELEDLRDRAIALRTFRSESIAGAEGRLEDASANLEGHRADLEEAQADLKEAQTERDRADLAIVRLEDEIEDLEDGIEELRARSAQGQAAMEAFGAVDELRAELEELTEELAERQAECEELRTERSAVVDEIEGLSDDA